MSGKTNSISARLLSIFFHIIIIMPAENNPKLIRIYTSLTKTEKAALPKWLLNHKADSNEILNLFEKMLEYVKIKPQESWSAWVIPFEIADLSNKMSQLIKAIEDFLLSNHAIEQPVERNMQLFHIYKKMGLPEYIKPDLGKCEKDIPEYDFYTKYDHAQLMRELYLMGFRKEDSSEEINLYWQLFWVNEMLFYLCNNLNILNNLNKLNETVKIATLPFAQICEYIAMQPSLAAHELVQFWQKLYPLMTAVTPTLENVEAIEKQFRSANKYLPAYRHRDVFVMIQNIIQRKIWKQPLTQDRAYRVWMLIYRGYNKGWLFVGKKLLFRTYQNLVKIAIKGLDDKPTRLKDALKLLSENDISLEGSTKEEQELLDILIAWKSDDFHTVLAYRSSKQVNEKDKQLVYLLRMKCLWELKDTKPLEGLYKEWLKQKDKLLKGFYKDEFQIWFHLIPFQYHKNTKDAHRYFLLTEINRLKTLPIYIGDTFWYSQIIESALGGANL